jgi:hypothetical protein
VSVVEKLISEQNQYDLFYNILLSVKSQNPSVSIDENLSKGKCKLESSSISITKTNSVKTEMSSFNIKIEREEVPKLFSKNTYKYSISLHGSTRGYSSFNQIYFKDNMISNKCRKVIGDIFDYLIDIEEKREIEKTNNAILNIINDISTTVDKAYKRDNKIDEVLNNN